MTTRTSAPNSLAPTPKSSVDIPQSFLSKRVKSILSSETVLDGFSRTQLEYLSDMICSDPGASKRGVRHCIERAIVETHARFINEYEENVAGLIARKYSQLEQFDERITEGLERLSINRDQIGAAIEHGVNASAELGEVERKLELITQFRELFVIDSPDTAHRSQKLVDVLGIVESVEIKRRNCQVLLGDVANAQIGIESLNKSVDVLESMYDKIAFLGMQENDLVPSLLRRSLTILQDRPNLFHEALLSACMRRCDSLSLEFLHVLNRDEDGLELNSFDSFRFSSDMLSWFLDSVVSERDWFESIVGSVRESIWSGLAPIMPKMYYLDSILSGVIEMVESRFSNSVKSTFNVLDLYKLSKIVSFYLGKVSGCCIEPLNRMRRLAFSAFQNQWERRIQSERSSTTILLLIQPSSGLNPPPIVNETVFLIENILRIEAENLSEEDDEDQLFSVLSTGIDPLIQLCFSQHSLASPAEASVFLLNCLSVLQAPLLKFSALRATEETVRNINALIIDQVDSLVQGTLKIVLRTTGMGLKIDLIRESVSSKKPIETVPDLHPIALSSSIKSFYSILFTQGIAAISHVDALVSRELRAKARTEIGASLAVAYEELYNAIHHLGVANHTPDQIRALLDL